MQDVLRLWHSGNIVDIIKSEKQGMTYVDSTARQVYSAGHVMMMLRKYTFTCFHLQVK